MAKNCTRILLPFIFFSLWNCSGCVQSTANQSDNFQMATLIPVPSKSKIAYIHYYDMDRSTGNLIQKTAAKQSFQDEDLIAAVESFLKQTHFPGKYSDLKLNEYFLVGERLNFDFIGKLQFDHNRDEKIFKKALELTIAQYSNNLKIDLYLNDNIL